MRIACVSILALFLTLTGCRDRDGRGSLPPATDGGGGMTDSGGMGRDGGAGTDAGGGGGTDAGGGGGGNCDVTIKFEAPVPATCTQSWTDSGASLSLIDTTLDDCGSGSCSFDGSMSGELWLFPARLRVDLASLGCTVGRVEIDVTDYCGAGCSRAYLLGVDDVDLARATNATSSTLETMTLTPLGEAPLAMAVSSCEGVVHEIRIR